MLYVPAMATRERFIALYEGAPPPWDIGRPQPDLVAAFDELALSGSALDLGCGTGENALYLAGRGCEVTGVDAAPTAIERARAKAAERGQRATFVVADALEFLSRGAVFDTAIDSGFFHTLSDDDRVRFERGLSTTIRPGGRYFMLCFSDREAGWGGPRRVSRDEIWSLFSERWRIDSIVEERFAVRYAESASQGPIAWLASLTRLSGEADGKDR